MMEEKKNEPNQPLPSANLPENHEHDVRHCLNCGAVLTGKYCSECGQKDQELHESFWHLMAHFAGDFIHFDSKFFRTLTPLLVKPGFLTAEYMRGKRVGYMKPVQLYIFISVVFFLVYFSFFNEKIMEVGNAKENPALLINDPKIKKDTAMIHKLKKLPPPIADKIIDSLNEASAKKMVDSALAKSDLSIVNETNVSDSSNLHLGWTVDDKLPSTVKAYKDSIDQLPKSQRPGFIRQAITIKAIEINERKEQEGVGSVFEALKENFMHNIPKLMFLMLPFFALILKFLYIRRKTYLVDHAIFTLHFHSFIFLLLLLLSVINLLTGFSLGIGYILLLVTIYLMIALRNVYRQSWIKTFFKVLFTYFLYSFSTALVVLIGLMISAASL